MLADRITQGDTIGIFCSSHVGDLERYKPIISSIERCGYKVKLSDNFLEDTYGYAGSEKERADDINALVDDDVKMILFGGGESAVEILPYIDYDNIKRHSKLFSSYSDGTSILNAIHAQTGLVTYYGFGTGQFDDMKYYDYMQFYSHFHKDYSADEFVHGSEWRTICGGKCEGTLIGGYAMLFGLMLSNKYFKYDENKKYVLFLEDRDAYSSVGAVASYLTFIEQSAIMNNVTGLIFGHYSANVPEDFLKFLERFGAKNNIPVVYSDDFGHGPRHAIFPIGVDVKLDADSHKLTFVNYNKSICV